MVSHLRRKELIVPLVLGLVFSLMYYILPLKYLAAGVIGLIGVVLIFYDLRLGLMAGVLVLPFLPDMLGLLFMFFLAGVFAYHQFFVKHTPLTKDSIDMPLILFILIMIISTITSINPMGSFRDLALHFGGLSFLFVMMNSIDNKEDLNKIITVLVFSATLVALYGLYQFVVGVEIEKAWLDVENNPDIRTRVYSVLGTLISWQNT